MFGHRALKALAQNISGVKMAAPLCAESCRWLVWFQKGLKRLKAETWGTGCLEVSMVQLCNLLASKKSHNKRKTGRLVSCFHDSVLLEGWHCLVWWTPGVSASAQVLRFPASFHVLDAAKHPYPRCWSERRFQQKWRNSKFGISTLRTRFMFLRLIKIGFKVVF